VVATVEMGEIFAPELRLLVLDGWFAKESHTLLAPDGQANVIASSEPLDASTDLQRYAQEQGERLSAEFPGYVEHDFRAELVLGGRPGFVRTFSWTPPDGQAVTQIQLYYVRAGRGYTATATTPTSEFGRYEAQLRQILDGLLIADVETT
jgi:hypothetical protein